MGTHAFVPGAARRLAGTVILLVTAAGPLAGQEPDTARVGPDTTGTVRPDSVPFVLQGLRVEAARPTITSGGASAVQLLLDSIRTVPSPTLAEVLREMPFIRIRTNSRGEVQPSLRGMEERQIAVLVDGVPITLGWDNRADLSVVPLAAAKEVRLVRGLSSVLAGPNALGGVVEVDITSGDVPPPRRDPLRFRAGLDQTGALAFSGEASHVLETASGAVWTRYGGGYRKRDGLALADGLSPIARDDDGHLVNSDMQYGNGFVALRWQAEPAGEWLSLSSSAFVTERGVVPELHLLGESAPEPRFWRIPSHWRSVTSVSGGTGWGETPFGEGDLEVAFGLDFQRLEIDSFESIAFADSVDGETGNDRTLSFRLLGDHTLGSGSLRGALTFAETWHEEILTSGPPAEFRQRLWSLGVEAEQPLAPGSRGGLFSDPRLTLGVSLDGASTPETGGRPRQPDIQEWGARLAAQVDVAEETATLHGGVSRKVRFPALRELFSGALGKFAPNPDLEALTLKVGEVGGTVRPGGRVELQATLFQQRLEGAIVRAVLPDGRFQRQNRGETRATGVELLATARLAGTSLRGELTLQDVRLLDDEGEEPGEEPEYQPEVVAGLDLSAPVALGVTLHGRIEHLGSQFGANAETGGLEEVEPQTYVEAGASRRFEGISGIPTLSFALTVENVTDEVLLDQLGLPRPGRTIRAELQIF